MHTKGYLVLENGQIFSGNIFGAHKKTFGELIFNTSMTGYQEITYDPSYKGQIVVMTYPLIGNYGTNKEDVESYKIHLEGFVVKELSKNPSNWQADISLEELFKKNNVTGIENIDTRKLTLILREQGALKAGIFPADENNFKNMIQETINSPSIVGKDIVKKVIKKEPYWWSKTGKYKVLVIDCGVKYNILQLLAKQNFAVRVIPADYPYQEIIKEKPDGILISNGPGDPQPLDYLVQTLSNLIERYPVFGICLGQQILGMVFGGKIYKLKFGHHGANHPTKTLKTGKIDITVQNHGFCVDINSLKDPNCEITHINLNDGTMEGFRHKKYPAFSVQFHPEASPGPHDANYIFNEFWTMICQKEKT
ncbi:MAG: glutamine-hydrolyzing carbamoyl-phosphate synthase small subunit [Candidatus Omnitrophica bacterium]|jgi:carbamoyl-phosphate synthase small subunit|nr:glutamine-hydrolyzing carbamoyl-phosphate synthase small subunit [Candidatus Omnitrophota bacterium]